MKLARFGIARQMLRTRANEEQLRAKYAEAGGDPSGGGSQLVVARTAQARLNHRMAIEGELVFWDSVEARLAAGDADVAAAMGVAAVAGGAAFAADPRAAATAAVAVGLSPPPPPPPSSSLRAWDIACTVMLPQDTNTFQQLADRGLVTPEVAREMHRVWFEQQKRYARAFAEGKLGEGQGGGGGGGGGGGVFGGGGGRIVVVPNAGAQMHRDAPDVVVAEIRRLVDEARGATATRDENAQGEE